MTPTEKAIRTPDVSAELDLLVKVGSKHKSDPRYFLDGQILDVRPRGYYSKPENPGTRARNCVIETHLKYWDLRGSTNWGFAGQKLLNMKKYLTVIDSSDNQVWEVPREFYKEDAGRTRDWFIDFKWMLDNKWITQQQYYDIYNRKIDPGRIYLDRDISSYIFHEDSRTRLDEKQNMAWTGGGGPRDIDGVGAGDNYVDVAEFATDINGQTLTGDAFGEHTDHNSSVSAFITFDCETDGFLLKLTAKGGAEHNGTYGNVTWQAGDGARISLGHFDAINFSESTPGELADIEISNLVIDGAGGGGINCQGARLGTGGSGLMTMNRLITKGNAVSDFGFYMTHLTENWVITNCLAYDFTGAGSLGFRTYAHGGGPQTGRLYNNTAINNDVNFHCDSVAGTLYAKNNLAQGDTGGNDYTGQWENTAKNVSEDATSPDAAYQNKDVHTNSVFKDYGNDDYRLDSAGDATNLAILDDGDNLYGSGVTEDIEGQARDNGTPFWVAASHILAVGGLSIPIAMHHYQQIQGH